MAAVLQVLFCRRSSLALFALSALPLFSFLPFAGCAAPPPVPPPETNASPPPPTPPVPQPAPQYDEVEWRRLMDAAKRALAKDRLTTPDDDNAFDYYSKALAMTPDSTEVAEGFERIVERYFVLAARAIDRERWESARAMVDLAALVDSTHPGIEPMRRQIHLLANARRLVLELDTWAVRERRREVAAKLARFGQDARRPGARVTIRAGSDADGRWIYEQLSNASGERRILGGIEIGRPPKVTVLLLPEQGGG